MCGAEGERKSSQAKGLVHDETSKSAVQPHAEGEIRRKLEKLSGTETEAQNPLRASVPPFLYHSFYLFDAYLF